MKSFFCSILILIGINNCFSQIQFLEEVNVKAEKFFIDILDNYYFYLNNSLQKTDKKTGKQTTYDTKRYGNLTYIDVSDPFSTLLFYAESNIVVFLDNYLAEQRSALTLDDLGFFATASVCNSHRGFWLFDEQQSNVNLVSKDLKIIQRGTNLYAFTATNQPLKMLETNNFLVLQLDSTKLIVLDKFGSYYKTIFTQNLSLFDVFNDDIYALESDKIKKYSLIDNSEEEIDILQIADIQSFNVSYNYFFFLTAEKLIKYKF
jgi:hypothetical protein